MQLHPHDYIIGAGSKVHSYRAKRNITALATFPAILFLLIIDFSSARKTVGCVPRTRNNCLARTTCPSGLELAPCGDGCGKVGNLSKSETATATVPDVNSDGNSGTNSAMVVMLSFIASNKSVMLVNEVDLEGDPLSVTSLEDSSPTSGTSVAVLSIRVSVSSSGQHTCDHFDSLCKNNEGVGTFTYGGTDKAMVTIKVTNPASSLLHGRNLSNLTNTQSTTMADSGDVPWWSPILLFVIVIFIVALTLIDRCTSQKIGTKLYGGLNWASKIFELLTGKLEHPCVLMVLLLLSVPSFASLTRFLIRRFKNSTTWEEKYYTITIGSSELFFPYFAPMKFVRICGYIVEGGKRLVKYFFRLEENGNANECRDHNANGETVTTSALDARTNVM